MTAPVRLDVIVPTYNREALLRKTLESFMEARVPDDLHVEILVVDNNSRDNTAAMVQRMAEQFPLPLRYLLEVKQSSSHTRNAGILASQADLVGFVDDDEEIEPDWLQVVAREFRDPAVDFIGGPYLPNWVSPAPDWLPPGYHSVIGAIPPKPRASFGPEFKGTLMGGNSVFRRSVFYRVGLYSTQLGRSGKGLLSEEDADMQRRLQAAHIRGVYVPDLAIRHYIAPERLTRSYHRRWVYWRGASQGVLDRTGPDPHLPYLFGVPRYRYAQAVRGLLAVPGLHLRGKKAEAFCGELAAWDLFGFLYGKHLMRVESMYQQVGAIGAKASKPSA